MAVCESHLTSTANTRLFIGTEMLGFVFVRGWVQMYSLGFLVWNRGNMPNGKAVAVFSLIAVVKILPLEVIECVFHSSSEWIVTPHERTFRSIRGNVFLHMTVEYTKFTGQFRAETFTRHCSEEFILHEWSITQICVTWWSLCFPSETTF